MTKDFLKPPPANPARKIPSITVFCAEGTSPARVQQLLYQILDLPDVIGTEENRGPLTPDELIGLISGFREALVETRKLFEVEIES